MLQRLAASFASAGFVFCGAAMMSSVAHAATINITPSTPGIISGSTLTPPTGSTNCEALCVYTAFGLTFPTPIGVDPLTLFYKADVPSAESGSFATSYKTTFSNTANDPADALIEFVSGSFIACPECYMAIKDGNQDPSYYFIDLGNLDLDGLGGNPAFAWNGLDSLNLTGFWPDSGAISHVSIWGRDGGGGSTGGGTTGGGTTGGGTTGGGTTGGGSTGGGNIPEPGSIGLVGLGLGLLGAGFMSRRRRQAQPAAV